MYILHTEPYKNNQQLTSIFDELSLEKTPRIKSEVVALAYRTH